MTLDPGMKVRVIGRTSFKRKVLKILTRWTPTFIPYQKRQTRLLYRLGLAFTFFHVLQRLLKCFIIFLLYNLSFLGSLYQSTRRRKRRKRKGLNIHSFEDNQHQPNNIYLQNKNKKYILDNKNLITKSTLILSFTNLQVDEENPIIAFLMPLKNVCAS